LLFLALEALCPREVEGPAGGDEGVAPKDEATGAKVDGYAPRNSPNDVLQVL